MPTYDYRCARCKEKFEFFTPIAERDKVKCPTCKRKAKRLMTTDPTLRKVQTIV